MKLSIPRKCPKCNGAMFCVSYDTIIKFLKERSWHHCGTCNYSQETADFKRELLTV